MKKLICGLLMIGLVSMSVLGCGQKENPQSTETENVNNTAGDEKADNNSSGKPKVQIDIEDYGTIIVELEPDVAPITVDNFVSLVKDGFYDGLTFHRIIQGFMMQGGDPLGNGTGGSENNIKGEFSSNGVENNLSHKRGVISMARSQEPDSASSQFFIMHQDNDFLDGDYAAFGTVIEGIEVVDKVCEEAVVQDGNGTVNTDDQPVIKSMKVID